MHRYVSIRRSTVRGHRLTSSGFKLPSGSGIWVQWKTFDDTLTAAIDPFGMAQVFYYADDDGLLLSTSPLTLIEKGANSELDTVAIAAFHILGWYLNEDTSWKHIKVLPAGGTLTWDGTLRVSRREHTPTTANITRTEAIDIYSDLFAKSIAECWAQHPATLPLSGGRDSRHIVLELRRQGHRPNCVTYGSEWATAHDVASALDCPLSCIDTDTPQRDQIEAMIRTHLCSDELAAVYPWAKALTARAFFDGIGGDVLSRNKNFTQPEKSELIRRGKTERLVHQIEREHDVIFGAPLLERLPKAFHGHIPTARTYIAESLSRYRDHPDPFSAFTFWTRTRREISLAAQMVENGRPLCPYLNVDLANFCLSLPESVTADGAFHDAIINRYGFDLPYYNAATVRHTRRSALSKSYDIIAAMIASRRFGIRAVAGEAVAWRNRAAFWRRYRYALRTKRAPPGATLGSD